MSLVRLPDATCDLLRESGHDIVVVGAGGWISTAYLDGLRGTLGRAAFARRVKVLGSSARSFALADGTPVEAIGLDDWRRADIGRCVVVHNAFLTRDRVAQLPLDVYVARNRAISGHVRDLVAARDVRGFILPSSGAVYTPDLARNPYGALKLEDEHTFLDMAAERRIPIAVPRIFALSGEYINKIDIYALACFIRNALRGEPIEIRARHPVYRSYTYVGDLIALTLAIALSPEPVRAVFDTVGTETVEVGDLARLVLAVLRPDGTITRPDHAPEAPADRYVGEGERIAQLWQRYDLAPLDLRSQIARTAAYLAGLAASGR